MISIEIAHALARFFLTNGSPSHHELTRLFHRAKLQDADPRNHKVAGMPVGKMNRVRDVLVHAAETDPTAGSKLVDQLLAAMRAAGCFRPGADSYAGEAIIQAAREAFAREGYELDRDGHARPAVLDGLGGAQLTAALWAYVRRARAGATDAPLVIGTNKDLVEATARHVLVETTGTYQPSMDFPTTVYLAFDRLGLATMPPATARQVLDRDPRRQVHQALYLLACAVNRVRNAEGTGHGRPTSATATGREARLLAQAGALVSQLLLEALMPEPTPTAATGAQPVTL
jgi:hypothetical protein